MQNIIFWGVIGGEIFEPILLFAYLKAQLQHLFNFIIISILFELILI